MAILCVLCNNNNKKKVVHVNPYEPTLTPWGKLKVCNHQAYNLFYLWHDAWSGDLQALSEIEYCLTWYWISLQRPGVNKQHKTQTQAWPFVSKQYGTRWRTEIPTIQYLAYCAHFHLSDIKITATLCGQRFHHGYSSPCCCMNKSCGICSTLVGFFLQFIPYQYYFKLYPRWW